MAITKRQKEIFNIIRTNEEKIGSELCIIYNSFTKSFDIADINFNNIKNGRLTYDQIDNIKCNSNTLYRMIDNGLLDIKEIDGFKFTTTSK